MRILVTGASGAIGAALAPELARAGHAVRAFARDRARVTCGGVDEVVTGDALTGAGLDAAVADADVVYYLIHSMEPAGAAGGSFPERERRSAANVVAACERAGVRRVIYLGGLVPAGQAPSEHLASRLAVEDALLGSAPEAVALRASIVISAASRSFRFLVRLVERTPVLPLPTWRDHRTQPIDGRDVIAYLVAAGTSPVIDGPVSLDIAGPDVLTYGELIRRIRDALLLDRPPVELPFALTPVASVVAAAIAGEDLELVGPLMEGLSGDLLPRDDRAHELFGVRLHRFDAAVERALRDWETSEELAAR
ncbi:MAG TPA: NAD(P)H-binding protein [Solirubrobacteraceae bacterium]|nr:NAD(P)H-binding protein [Solirubrobacteraceae bacterium]